MPQHPRTLHLLIHDAVKYALSTEKHSHVMGNPKRYATYFPSEASLEAEQEHDASDNDSTWEFSAPLSPPRTPSGTSCNTSNSSPAQDIAIRYRAGISFGFSNTVRSSSPPHHSEPDSWEIASRAKPSDLGHVQAALDQDIKAAYRQSRHEALLKTVCLSLSGVSSRNNNSLLVSGSCRYCAFSRCGTGSQGCLQSTWLSGHARER
jgi:hypothetical protein